MNARKNKIIVNTVIKSFYYVSLFILIGCLSKPDDRKKSSDIYPAHNRTEAIRLDSLENHLNNLLNNHELSLDSIESIFDRIEADIAQNYGTPSLYQALITHKRGNLEYYRWIQGDEKAFQEAINYFRSAIEMRSGIPADCTVIADLADIKGYNNIGACYMEINAPYKSLENLNKALLIAEKYSDNNVFYEQIMKLQTRAARTYTELGDYENAISYYDNIIMLCEKNSKKDTSEIFTEWKFRAIIEKAAILADRLEQPENALPDLLLAENKLIKSHFPCRDILLASTYHKLGLTCEFLEKYDESNEYYQKSVKLNAENHQTEGMANNYYNLGFLFSMKSQYDSAVYYLHKAGELYELMGITNRRAYIFLVLAFAEYNSKHYHRCIELLNQSLKLQIPGFIPVSVHSNPEIGSKPLADKKLVLKLFEIKSQALMHIYCNSKDPKYLYSTYDTYTLADYLIGLIRSEFVPDASKLNLVKTAKPIYEKAIEACRELYLLNGQDSCMNRAFEYSEKSRAIILLDAVRKTDASATIPENLIEREKSCNLSVNYYEKQVALQNQGTGNISPLVNPYDSLLIYRRRHASILKDIKVRFPDYHDLIYDQQTRTPEQLMGYLHKDESLVEYFVGDSTVYSFVINQDTVLFVKNDRPDSILKWANEFTALIQIKDQRFVNPSYQLYGQLIRKLEEKIPLNSKLIIIPDGALSLISFDALITREPDRKRIYFPAYRDYLLFDKQISYAFSASSLTEADKKEKHPAKTLLGIAPEFKKSIRLNEYFFQSLKWNIKEVQAVSRVFPKSKKLIKQKATIDNFNKLASNYQLIHFATHAIADNENGDLSYILFGPKEADKLYAKDLYTLQLNCESVVLSACQTGTGPLKQGEGIISLARGFIYAGSSSVITSLWSVSEKSNMDIILSFYKNLKKGEEKEEALRVAKINFLESVDPADQEKAHPYFWAPLVCIGNMKPLEVSRSLNWIPCIAGSVLFISLLTLLLSRKKRAKPD